MASRITQTFQRLAAEGRPALIPYVTAGDPDLQTTAHVLDALVDNGADIIELGVPFSDPMADGPVIQRAMQRALASGTTLNAIFNLLADFRTRHADTPIVLFGYMNPLFRFGLDRAVKAAASAGADGFLVVDLPPESAGELTRYTKAAGLDFIALFTPTTDVARMASICKHASGFAYCVSVAGVTGSRIDEMDVIQERVELVRQQTGLPAAVGFGIRTAADAAEVGGFADGVVIGSALITAMAKCAPVEVPIVAGEFIAHIRQGLDTGGKVIQLKR